jgi:hypothetical protein
MANRFYDLSLSTLRRILKATEQVVGPDAPSVVVIRRAIENKKLNKRPRRYFRRT